MAKTDREKTEQKLCGLKIKSFLSNSTKTERHLCPQKLPYTQGEPPFILSRHLATEAFRIQAIAAKVFAARGEMDTAELNAEDAEKLIAEGGCLGAKQTSKNIVKFAIVISGNKTSKLNQIKEAINSGLREIEHEFSGKLPDISYRTHEAIMEELDAWSKNLSCVTDVIP